MSLLDQLKGSDWLAHLEVPELMQTWHSVEATLKERKAQGATIFPEERHWLRAFSATPFEQTRVVILGQDPYHGPGQAQGLSFSVPDGFKIPPSLKNIAKEIEQDTGETVSSGDLKAWTQQGVLLLNAVLTVESGQANSHQGIGWETITDAAIKALSDHRDGVIFMLWGGFAQKKASLIDDSRHHVLLAPHPSPLSAHRGWFGCGHFSAVNRILESQKSVPIQWATNGPEQASLW